MRPPPGAIATSSSDGRRPRSGVAGASAARAGGAASRLGLVECLNHELLTPYPVMWEKPGDLVAHFKATVLLLPNGSDRITGLPPPAHVTDKAVTDEALLALLATNVAPPPKVKKDKKAGKAEPAAA